ncbi:MAG: hypothetical protein U0441_15380 [Polyangiaceae bacterium]
MGLSNPERVAYGGALLERIGKPAPALKADLAAFKAQHTAFCQADAAVATSEKAYEKAMDAVGPLDAKRDKTILEIADKAPGHGLGTRASPLGKFSTHAPSTLTKLPYAVQTKAVNDLLDALEAASTPPEIAKLCARLAAENKAVDDALKALTSPADALNQARARRDTLLPEWNKALRHLKDSAKVAFRDAAGRFDAVFAPVVAVQSTSRVKRGPRKVAVDVTSTPVAEGAVAPAAPKKSKRRARRK